LRMDLMSFSDCADVVSECTLEEPSAVMSDQ